MIDDRVCLFYVAERIQSIVDGESTAQEVLYEMNHNIGVNARIKRNKPEDWLSKRDREDLEKWKKKNPKFNENNIPKTVLNRLIWMHLKEIRKFNNLNQNELAKEVDFTQVSISHVENGRSVPSPEVQLRIANVLGYELEELIELMKNSIDWYKYEEVIADYIKEQRANGASSRPSIRSLGV